MKHEYTNSFGTSKFILYYCQKYFIMTKQQRLTRVLQSPHIFNLTKIEEKAGLRKLKLIEFSKGTTKLTETETASVLDCIRNATKLQK
jgi:hypothetical protein